MQEKSASKAVLNRMFLTGCSFTLHATRPTPHGASRLVQVLSAWSVKTRRAPSRRCRDARAMHDNEYAPPPAPPHTPLPVSRLANRRRLLGRVHDVGGWNYRNLRFNIGEFGRLSDGAILYSVGDVSHRRDPLFGAHRWFR